MNVEYKLKKIVFENGKVSRQPLPIFIDQTLEKTPLFNFLWENDDDYNFGEVMHILDGYKNEAIWYADHWVMYTHKEGTATLEESDYSRDGAAPEELLNSITVKIEELKNLLLDYRKRAKEFREQLPETQKDEDQRRLAESFGFM